MAKSEPPAKARANRRSKKSRIKLADFFTPKAFVIGIFAVALAIIAPSWFESGGGGEAAFLKLAKEGRPMLAQVKAQKEVAGTHVASGTKVNYGSKFPTSGPMWGGIPAGFYTSEQVTATMMHPLEHGFIVIYYEKLDSNARETLQEWAKTYTNPMGGIIVTPSPGLGKTVVLTAWNRILRLDSFVAKDTAAFVDAFRGRGPEGRIR